MTNETLRNIRMRRSVRSFEPRQIRDEELNAVLEAGTWAPTGMGKQSPRIVAVQDPETIAELSRLNAQVMGTNGDPFYGAPTVLIVFADSSVPTWVEDGSLVLGDLLLAAYSIGLGSCWIHRARQVFDLPEGRALAEKWGLDSRYRGVGHCILGYPAGSPSEPKPRRADYILCPGKDL